MRELLPKRPPGMYRGTRGWKTNDAVSRTAGIGEPVAPTRVGKGPVSTPSGPPVRVPSVMCGRPRRSKGDLVCCAAVGCGHVSGLCCAALRTAGPDAIRSLAPKQIYALEWRITLDGFLQAPGSTGSPSRHHRPPHPSAVATADGGSLGFRLRHLGLLPACDRLFHARAKPIRSAPFC
jgi:hypothetical protein